MKRQQLRFLLRQDLTFVGHKIRRFWIGGTIIQVIFLLGAFWIQYIVDAIVAGKRGRDLFFWVGIFIFFSFVDIFFGRVVWSYKDYLVQIIKKKKIGQVMEQFLLLDYATIAKHAIGKLQTRINQGVEAHVNFVEMSLQFVIHTLIRGAGVIIIFTIMMPWMNILLIVATISAYYIHVYRDKKVQPLHKQVTSLHEHVGDATTKIISDHHLIVLNNAQHQELKAIDKTYQSLPHTARLIDMMSNVSYTVMDFLFRLGESLCYLLIGYAIINGTSTVGQMTSVITLLRWSWWPISSFLDNAARFSKAIVRINKLNALLHTPITIVDGPNDFVFNNGTIVFKNVGFRYNDQTTIMSNFNLTIAGGKTTALVGHSGSGKSTLVKLIMRFFDPHEGQVIVDGQDLKDLKKSSWYKHIGYLPQEPSIFNGTVRENICYGGGEQIDDEQIRYVLKQAHADHMVERFAHKLDTMVGEKGVKLSGGERQRLALARLFLKKPDIIILDEPTSALDSESEHAITQSLKTLIKGKTCIVIAHRLQTVMHADTIIVLEKGKIIEMGDHYTLIQQGKTYAHFLDLQQGILHN